MEVNLKSVYNKPLQLGFDSKYGMRLSEEENGILKISATHNDNTYQVQFYLRPFEVKQLERYFIRKEQKIKNLQKENK